MDAEDQSWILLPKSDARWQAGYSNFMKNAFEGRYRGETAACPCARCCCMAFRTRDEVEKHLFDKGFHPNFAKRKRRHRAPPVPEPEPVAVHDDEDFSEGEAADTGNVNNLISSLISGAVNGQLTGTEEPNDSAKNFFKLLEEARKALYPGCKKATKVSFVVRLFQIKCQFGITNNAMEQILHLFCLVLPEGHCVPDSLDKIRKVVRELGLEYQKIHACVNDCVLFRGKYEKMNTCPTCGEIRWRNSDSEGNAEGGGTGGVKKKNLLPRKILRYFPLTPRLQRLYMNESTSTSMRWHKDELVEDGKVRHPANSKAWKHVDEKFYEHFAKEPRNVRLGLASDGFNPFGMLNVNYTTWPVILIPYNLLPWLCLKQSYWMMSMLIPGPKSPGINIDVYLQPLIDELHDLWDKGAVTWDAKVKRNFTLRAILLWTINDFPAYAMLSGWSTKGKFACPYCHKDTDYLWLKHGRKHCYMGHRRWLPSEHRWRTNRVSFNNMDETREALVPLSGEGVLHQYESFEQVTFGKTTTGKRKQRDEDVRWHNWRKKSVFFQLPYWKSLLIRHNLDVMHIEKNICESLLGTLLGLANKSKDSEKARLDLQELGIREDQHPVKEKGKYTLPPALYTLGKNEKEILCKFLKDVKMPDGYAAHIKRCVDVDGCKVTGLKSHDYHVILQKLLPLVARHILPPDVVITIIELSMFFDAVCSKELQDSEVEKLEKSIGQTLCRLEMIFPPAFFDVMMHLPVHIAGEARLGGPVSYRWMYPVERYLRTLKGYVRNKACPEGSIAEGYISEECLTFCSRFFEDFSTKLNREERQEKSTVNEPPSGLSVFGDMDFSKKRSSQFNTTSPSEFLKMRHYILSNCDECIPWIEKHKSELTNANPRSVERRHKEKFVAWFEHTRDVVTGAEPRPLELFKTTRMKRGKWSSKMSESIYINTSRKLSINESNEEGIEESRHDTAKEDQVLQETYKETTGAKSNKSCGHGYMNNPNKNQLLQQRYIEQEREIVRLKEHLAQQEAQKGAEKAQLAASIRASVMQEVQAMMAQNINQCILSQQTDAPGTNNTTENEHTLNPHETNYTIEDEHTTAPVTNHTVENEQTTAVETNNTTSDEAGSNEEVLHVTPMQKSVETPNQEREIEPRSILTTQKENNPPTVKSKSTKVSKSLFTETNGKGRKGTTTKYISTNGLHQIAVAAKTRAQKKQKAREAVAGKQN